MSIVAAYALAHPPILWPEVGCGEERKISQTAQAYETVARRAAAHQPDVIIISSPHATLYADYFHISPGSTATGNLAQFRAPGAVAHVDYDAELVQQIEREAQRLNLPAGTMGERDRKLDHGTLIPLLFLQHAGYHGPIIRIGLSGLGALSHYRLGQCIASAVNALGRKAVYIASGDLSHKLKVDGPYGFAPEGPAFDEALTSSFASGDFAALLAISPKLAEAAAECGLRSFQIMAGALDGQAVQPEQLSYEGPFGVGYAVAAFEVLSADEKRHFGDQFELAQREKLAAIKAAEDEYVRLARLSLETFVRTGEHAPVPQNLPPDLTDQRAGVFVSLHKDRQLRGCIGTIATTQNSIAAEIMHNAISAAAHDPRFDPVLTDELPELEYSVDVLGPAERIPSKQALDPARYGVIVQSGSRQGLLLPNLEGVDTVEQQLDIARRKAGIGADAPILLFRFEVVRHH